MKRNKLLLMVVVAMVIFAVVALVACEAQVDDNKTKPDVDKPITDQVPCLVDVQGTDGTAVVQAVDAKTKDSAIAAVMDAYYLPKEAETYVVDISIVRDGQTVKVDKPVTVAIELKQAALPLDEYVVFHIHDGKATEIVPTVDGNKLVFSVSDFSVFVVAPAHKHTYGEWSVASPATCGAKGLKTRTCIVCGAVERDELAATGAHTPGEWTLNEDTGYEEQTCTVCGAKLDEREHIHAYGEWTVTTPATCGADGVRTRACSGCDDVESEVITATGNHTAGDWTLNETTGKEEQKCLVCGQVLDEREPAAQSDGFVYTLSEDGNEYYIAGYEGSEKDIVIPATHEDKPVTYITSSAFEFRSDLTSVTIPAGVTVDDNAFYYCNGLSSITGSATAASTIAKQISAFFTVTITSGDAIPAKAFQYCGVTAIYFGEGCQLTDIGNEAFANSSLEAIAIPSGVTSIGKAAFYNCSALTYVSIPSGIETIDENTFKSCRRLSTVNIPDSVTTIGDYAFQYCEALISLIIPDSVTTIGSSAFYSSGLTTVSIGKGVTMIGSSAFRHCTDLLAVIFAEDSQLASIGDAAFYDCHKLISFTIPASVTSIGSEAFRGCYYLVEVYNKSSLVLSVGSWDNGFVGCYARDIYTAPYDSKVAIGVDGFIRYTDGGNVVLVGCFNKVPAELVVPDDVTEINQFAFNNNEELTSVTIPASVRVIGNSAFYRCSALTSVTFAEDSKLTTISRYAFGDCYKLAEVILPDAVTTLEDYAFCYTALASIIIPAKVTSIGGYAFAFATVESVTIPTSVTSIGDYAFTNCKSLTSINYQGTQAQWDEIAKGTAWDNDVGEYTIYFADEQ